MKRRTVLMPLATIAATVAVAGTTATSYISPVNNTETTPADTTKVIDIEEVVVIATPKENRAMEKWYPADCLDKAKGC